MEEQIVTPYLLYKDCDAMLGWLATHSASKRCSATPASRGT